MTGDVRNSLRFLMKNKDKRDPYFSLETSWHHSIIGRLCEGICLRQLLVFGSVSPMVSCHGLAQAAVRCLRL